MKIIINPPRPEWLKAMARPVQKTKDIEKIVRPIMRKVKRQGDKALKKFALEYDHVEIQNLQASREEIKAAKALVSPELQEAILQAKENIEKFHEAQATPDLEMEVMEGVTCMRRSVPIQKVGLYIPGGTAPLFSTVLMLGIPANLAGCEQIILCTPPNKEGNIHPAILYAADLIGIDKIVKAGGAQAIAALTYGTDSVPKVDKIFGPGNQYVTAAKQMAVKKGVSIDMPAGPSEVLVYADETAIPAFVAADLLSQAEHGVDSQVILVASSEKVANKILKEVETQLEKLPRMEMAKKALGNSVAFVMPNQDKAIDLINEYAPEHLIICVENEDEVVSRIINAGSVFIGNFTPESAGDYASGTNHTLPTYGYARNYSGVSLDSFVKKITYQKITEKGLQNLGPTIEVMAANELLFAHKNAVSIRLKYLKDNQ
ncbi:bifunctional histidinal dehydrogenase/ histidinol dehydrogenase [Rhodonellum psychrophilum GCM71 = DSM 17998]|uniref:Histidinol dehydrogenase n=2 Tax=Rhodonellum TaxID=336827 RepID=U5BKG7_9BACT|nr:MULTISPECIES: histidinol dehydrogenase [Rhodonellum]ERM80950.1 bifunctional histidinal dehydrogenase/ histidinol dehydrogenase [Rhodonellum psychrophilum GCM71 = DSM 17998]MDO9554751.1 histidinol dehydrogenase [Rhodonellum sp.]SDY82561.1 histidinol dehydrogenase [Rhodonellum ikkaensis]